jgi:hypothetical protein
MGDPFADEYIVSDISPARDEWRWAFRKPTLKFHVKDARNLSFVIEFFIPEVTFRETGPVTVSCYLGERFLEKLRCEAPGKHRLQAAVPEGWVRPGEAVTVTAEADRRWVSKEDGAQLSFLLGSAGFIQ